MVWLALRPVLHVEPPCFPRDRALEADSGCAHSRHSHAASCAAVFTRLEQGAFGCNATAFAAKLSHSRDPKMFRGTVQAVSNFAFRCRLC
jgi:hypothetical protein